MSPSQNVILLPPGGGATLSFNEARVVYKVSSSQTNGSWALLEHMLPAYYADTALHWHEFTHQGFYVLEGKVTFQLGAQFFMAESGAFVDVPPGVRHTFRNQQDQPARLLEVIIPGGMENSFKEMVSLTQSEPELLLQPHKLSGLFKRYDTYLEEEK